MRGDPYRSQRGTRSSPFSERSNAGPRENLGKKLFEHDLQLAILYIQSSVDVRNVLSFYFPNFVIYHLILSTLYLTLFHMLKKALYDMCHLYFDIFKLAN